LLTLRSAGILQVILPCWFDTLGFANRVEWLEIGVYGSRSAAPSVESGELSRALLKVLGEGVEAIGMRKKAKKLAEITGNVGGRKKACEKIIELLEGFSGAEHHRSVQAMIGSIQDIRPIGMLLLIILPSIF
jgi:UDP:flavonoid glycosyltransferase YjiC (YdhE family)